jgi:hypothetical protein
MTKRKAVRGWAIVFTKSGSLDTTDVMEYPLEKGKNIPTQVAFSIFPKRRDAIIYKKKWITIDPCKVVRVEIALSQ